MSILKVSRKERSNCSMDFIICSIAGLTFERGISIALNFWKAIAYIYKALGDLSASYGEFYG